MREEKAWRKGGKKREKQMQQQMQQEMQQLQQEYEQEMQVAKEQPIESLPLEALGKIHGSDGELTIFMQRMKILPKGGEI